MALHKRKNRPSPSIEMALEQDPDFYFQSLESHLELQLFALVYDFFLDAFFCFKRRAACISFTIPFGTKP